MKAQPWSKDRWCTSPWKDIAKFSSSPSSIHDWKNQFFLMSSSTSWGFPIEWGTPTKSTRLDLLKLTKIEEVIVEELKWLKVPSFSKLLYEDLLTRLYSKDLASTSEFQHLLFSCWTMGQGVLTFLRSCKFSIFLRNKGRVDQPAIPSTALYKSRRVPVCRAR